MNHSLIILRGFFSEWLTGCSPANPTMAGCEWKIQESSSCLVHKPGCLSWSLVYAGVRRSRLSCQRRNGCASKARAGKQAKNKSFLFFLSSYRLPAEGVAQNKRVSSCPRIFIEGMYLPTSKVWTRSRFTHFKPSQKISHRCAFHFWTVVLSRRSQVSKQD